MKVSLRIALGTQARAVFGAVAADPTLIAAGPIRENRTSTECELLCERLRPISPSKLKSLLKDGRELLVGQSTALRPIRESSEGYRAYLEWRHDGVPGWRGGYRVDERVLEIEELRFVGPGMVTVPEPPASVFCDSESDARRYSRLVGAIGSVGRRLRGLRGLVIGAGRTGSLAVQQLALLGLGSLVLVDPDRLELENLDSMSGVSLEDVGRLKVEAVAENACRIRPDLGITCLARSAVHQDVWEAARTADLIVSCVDRDAGRLAAARIARGLLRPHLDIGTGITHRATGERQLAGDARLLLPGEGCVCCVGGLANRPQAELELKAPPDAMRPGKPQTWADERLGSLITLNSLTVSTGIQLWLDLLGGSLASSLWHRIRWIEGKGLESNSAAVSAAMTCDLCQPSVR